MNTDEQNVGIRLSLLDRLTDPDPDSTRDPQASSWEELRQFKNSLCRDLAALLNTRRAREEFDPIYEQASASLLTYGIVDFTSYNLKDVVEQELVRRSLERSIRQFEPRLTRVTVIMDDLDSLKSVLRFQVKALLRTSGNAEAVLFDVSLHRESRRIADGSKLVNEELLSYYERELTFIRQMAGEFKEKYPKIAGRLQLDGEKECEDPHVERLIEAFALLAGRVHHKLDDEFPEITEALLDALYPHYIRPVPSMGIVQFQLDPMQNAPGSVHVPSGTTIQSRPVEGQICSFRTCYPVNLPPLKVTGASVSSINRFASPGMPADAAAVVRIQIECLGGLRFDQIPAESLRFFLNGESAAIHALYEFLFLNSLRVTLRAFPYQNGTPEVVLPATCLQQVGFDQSERILPYSDRSFLGYSLLQEYFNFPEKFFFFDLTGLHRFPKGNFGTAFEILIALKPPEQQHRLIALEQSVDRNTFQLGCTPMVNLFERIAEPIRISETKSEYPIIPDQHNQSSTEVYSVDRVTSTGTYLEEPLVYRPFYDLRHTHHGEIQKHFWYTHRRPSLRKNDNGTDVYISLVDLDFSPAVPPVELLSLRVTCTNRDRASRLNLTGDFGELEAEGIALLRPRCLVKPTRASRPPVRRGLQWRLISHLSLNYLSIVEKGKEALQEILRLYDFSNDPVTQKQIAGISNVTSHSAVSRVKSHVGVTFCRGTDVTIEFDEEQYVGTGVFLLSSVLQRFLGLYSAVNSFSRVTVKTKKGVLKQWPALVGEQILL